MNYDDQLALKTEPFLPTFTLSKYKRNLIILDELWHVVEIKEATHVFLREVGGLFWIPKRPTGNRVTCGLLERCRTWPKKRDLNAPLSSVFLNLFLLCQCYLGCWVKSWTVNLRHYTGIFLFFLIFNRL